MEDQIVRIICRLVVPFIQVYGIYVILYGHLSPGGGFAGGAIIGASMVLYALSFNLEEGSKKIPSDAAKRMESGGALVFAFAGIVSIILGHEYLTNLAAGFPRGSFGQLISGGVIPIISIAIGVKITSTIVTLFYHLIGGEKLEDGNA